MPLEKGKSPTFKSAVENGHVIKTYMEIVKDCFLERRVWRGDALGSTHKSANRCRVSRPYPQLASRHDTPVQFFCTLQEDKYVATPVRALIGRSRKD